MALFLIRLTDTTYVDLERSFRVKFSENKQSVSSASRDMQLQKENPTTKKITHGNFDSEGLIVCTCVKIFKVCSTEHPLCLTKWTHTYLQIKLNIHARKQIRDPNRPKQMNLVEEFTSFLEELG